MPAKGEMMKKILYILIAVLVLGVFAWAWQDKVSRDNASKELQPVSLALDWTPNTNHTGIYVAKANGWYRDQGIDLKILPYSDSTSSDVLVATGKADTGIGFTEYIVADAAVGSQVVSLAAIIAHNTSVIAVRQDSGITSPKQLDGKTFGGFGAPYEKAVMGQVIKNAGGAGNFNTVTVNTSPLQALKDKVIDFVWVFEGWEGLQAKREGLALTTFDLRDYGIPDYSTPNIISSPKTIEQKPELLKRFMAATVKGYEYARRNPEESARLLIENTPPATFADRELVYESQRFLSPLYQDPGLAWGVQDPSYWRAYPQFMLDKKTVLDASGDPVDSLNFSSLFTNEFLP
ncbi:MAG TPA: ABC transporter substrate-binding protein [Candidatus Saccharimonadales bacterium]|nr:ABC transporter substrate-binding protein [Candidatus Saccharimonadales bacterium]